MKNKAAKVAKEYCKAHPKTPSRTLARKMFEERPELYKSVEAARDRVRYLRGAHGKRNRASLTDEVCVGDGIVLAEGSGRYDPKILVFDIETSPNLAWVWGCWKQNVGSTQMEQYSEILCYAAKWLGKEKVMFDSKKKDKDDKRVCETLWDLFNEADMVIAHNARAFDNKTMNTRWLAHGMQPPSPYKTYDTLAGVKRIFRHPSNKLDSLARYHNIGQKVEHEGFSLWRKIMNLGAQYKQSTVNKAWATMKKYNIEDVRLLEEFYLLIRAWDFKHPNISIMYDDCIERCLVCGSNNIEVIPQASYTAVSVFESYKCNNCGKKMRSGKRDKADKEVYRNVL